MNESIGIQPVHIRFSTNSNNDSTQILTQNMIYLPPNEDKEDKEENETINTDKNKDSSNKNESYPLFTDQARISVSKLVKLPREKQIETFFIKNDFKKLIGSSFTKDVDERNENAEHNLRTMLQIFFPTIFPIQANMTETFSEKMKNVLSAPNVESNNSNVFSLLANFMGKENDYGYLNIEKQYTVTKITLINDIINDQLFKNLIQPSINFQAWRNETIQKYTENSTDIMTKIKTLIQKHFNDMKSSLKKQGEDPYKDLEKIKNTNSAINREAGHPPRLLVPYFDTLLNTEITNVKTIVDMFIEFYKLNNAAPNDKPNYIPYSIKTLPGFNDLLENSIKYKIDAELLNAITNMEVAINYLTKIKEKDKISNYVDKTVAEKIKTFTHLETFVQMIKEFRSPIRFYSNKQLTTLFNDTGKNIQPFMEFIEFLRKIVIEDKPEDKLLSNTTMIDNLKTGVMSVREKINDSKKDEKIDPLKQQTKLYYDCFVNFELIEGLLNDDVVELIECPYRNNFLSTIYNDLKTSENKNPMLFYNNIPVFDMAKYTQKNRSTKGSKKIKGGFIPRGTSLASSSPKTASKKYTRKRRKNRRNKYSLRSHKQTSI
jgi:hypothetical protein